MCLLGAHGLSLSGENSVLSRRLTVAKEAAALDHFSNFERDHAFPSDISILDSPQDITREDMQQIFSGHLNVLRRCEQAGRFVPKRIDVSP
jgi:hypothetical protein